jgi:hypothetical protein
MSDSTPPTRTISGPTPRQQLNRGVQHSMTVLVACGVLMWSVFNIWLNILEFRVNGIEGQNWNFTWLMVIVTCVIPFVIGLILLFKTLGKTQK